MFYRHRLRVVEKRKQSLEHMHAVFQPILLANADGKL
jgi:hypothetical protein